MYAECHPIRTGPLLSAANFFTSSYGTSYRKFIIMRITYTKKVVALAAVLITMGSAVYATDPPKVQLPATGGPAQASGGGNQNGAKIAIHDVPIGSGGTTGGGNATVNGNRQPTGFEVGVH